MNENQTLQRVQTEAGRRLEGSADHFLDRLAERLGGKATAAAVFGAPVERGGVTVIPVARVRWGFGGGSGRGRNAEEAGEGSGEGGGGGAGVSPLGYIEISDGRTEFRRIRDASSFLPLAPILIAAGVSIMLILTGVARVRRSAGVQFPRARVPWPPAFRA